MNQEGKVPNRRETMRALRDKAAQLSRSITKLEEHIDTSSPNFIKEWSALQELRNRLQTTKQKLRNLGDGLPILGYGDGAVFLSTIINTKKTTYENNHT